MDTKVYFKKKTSRYEIENSFRISPNSGGNNLAIDELLELVLIANEKDKFNLLISCAEDIYKFEVVYKVLFNEINLLQNDYFLFKYIFFTNIKAVPFLLQNGFNFPECLDFALKEICNEYYFRNTELLTILELLIDNGVDVTKNDNYAICAAIDTNDKKFTLFKFLEKNGADITARFNYPIKQAACDGKTDLVWHMLKSGVDFTECYDYVLSRCCIRRDYELVKFLLENGADAKNFSINDICVILKNSDLEMLKLLFEYGMNLSEIKESDIIFDNIHINFNKEKEIKKYNFLVSNADPLILFLLKEKCDGNVTW